MILVKAHVLTGPDGGVVCPDKSRRWEYLKCAGHCPARRSTSEWGLGTSFAVL